MDHVKQLELQVLLKFREVGGKVAQADFEKVFPVNTAEMRAIVEGLEIDKYVSHGFFSTQNNSTATHYVITERGKTRIIQLQKQRHEEEAERYEDKEVSGWTKWGAIGAWVAAGLTLIAIIVTIYLAYYPPKPTYVTRDNILEHLQVDTNAVRTDTAEVKIVKDCCNAEDSLEPKPPKLSSKDTIK